MDPLTQGVLGAALPQAMLGRRMHIGFATAFGFLAGMAADLDIFITSATDPLMFLVYHRHFTHSLIFIPVGGLACAAVFHWLIGRRRGVAFRHTLLACTLGYATHAPLDAMTSYGTLLFWPFSDERVSISAVSVIDPFFTLPLLVLMIVALVRKKPLFAAVGLAWAAAYLSLGYWQRLRAEETVAAVAKERGHDLIRIEAKPTFANILIWKTIYETPTDFYVDAVRAGISTRLFPGAALPKLDVARDFPWLDPDSQQAGDIERFRYFSQEYVAKDPQHANRIIDVRYSFVPNEVRPLWSIELSPDAGPSGHVKYLTHRTGAPADLRSLLRMAIEP